MSLCYIDTETTGLSLLDHDIWEIAYAFDDEPVRSAFVPHSLIGADPEALKVNGYRDRYNEMPGRGFWELELRERMEDEKPTLVGANVAFDAYRLSRRWGWVAPWRYRLIDIEAYAMPILGLDLPIGLHALAERLRGLGHAIDQPDHSAAADVAATRDVFKALRSLASDREREAARRALIKAADALDAMPHETPTSDYDSGYDDADRSTAEWLRARAKATTEENE